MRAHGSLLAIAKGDTAMSQSRSQSESLSALSVESKAILQKAHRPGPIGEAVESVRGEVATGKVVRKDTSVCWRL